MGPQSLEAHVEGVLDLARRDQLDRVLVSQDAGWYRVGEPRGGAYRPHTFLFDAFVPALRARGLREADIRTLLVENPAARVRRPAPGAGDGVLTRQRRGRPATIRPTSGGSDR